ncbi:hypothetical protein BUALT_Bualt03G0130900 [Buddleja alternifolia]|uniref:Uncharacterized protein n=1 Tax=Buddleja alternifolia TaxID=168488 RepID=A0AAV6XU98_9LAMI|nr:hypothetical protein BUALT_Bualt03G0130900 [Buddleja alternifolia]
MQDEIEAPIREDLIPECNSTYEDKDDEWFHISHPFHQSSAQQLISTFSDSPKSRGNDHKNRKKEPVVCRFTLNGQHDVKSLSKPSFTNVGSEEATKSNILYGKLNDNLNNKSGSVGKNTLPETKKISAKSVASGGGVSNSTSTISSERKLTGVPSPPFVPTGDLLLTLRLSVRKSFVTRQASRVDIKGMKQSGSWKSCSTKSSVGSSSTYIGCDGKNLTVTEHIEKTPESRNIMTMSQLPTNKIKREDKKAMDRNKSTEAAYNTRKANKRNPQIIPRKFTRARGIDHSSKAANPRVVKMKAHQESDRSKLVGPRVHLFAFKFHLQLIAYFVDINMPETAETLARESGLIAAIGEGLQQPLQEHGHALEGLQQPLQEYGQALQGLQQPLQEYGQALEGLQHPLQEHVNNPQVFPDFDFNPEDVLGGGVIMDPNAPLVNNFDAEVEYPLNELGLEDGLGGGLFMDPNAQLFDDFHQFLDELWFEDGNAHNFDNELGGLFMDPNAQLFDDFDPEVQQFLNELWLEDGNAHNFEDVFDGGLFMDPNADFDPEVQQFLDELWLEDGNAHNFDLELQQPLNEDVLGGGVFMDPNAHPEVQQPLNEDVLGGGVFMDPNAHPEVQQPLNEDVLGGGVFMDPNAHPEVQQPVNEDVLGGGAFMDPNAHPEMQQPLEDVLGGGPDEVVFQNFEGNQVLHNFEVIPEVPHPLNQFGVEDAESSNQGGR